jgi:hypothetical protein
MVRFPHIIRESARRVAHAADETVETLRDGRIEQEPAYTDRMLGRIEQAMNEWRVKGVRWAAKTLTDRGPNAQEKQYGADFVGVLDISLPEYAVKKGFLAQAKIIEPEDPVRGQDWERMVVQCETMLNLSPHSFLFVYSITGTIVVPAVAIVSLAEPQNPHELYFRKLARFYEEHFECFIGDRRIHAPTIEALEALREEMRARRLLYLAARS